MGELGVGGQWGFSHKEEKPPKFVEELAQPHSKPLKGTGKVFTCLKGSSYLQLSTHLHLGEGTGS
jgi:hypothetical protein